MAIPIYVVTGFLDAGKTTFLNHLLNRRDWRDVRMMVMQFETGEEDFQSRYGNCPCISFSKKMLEQQPAQIVEKIRSLLQSRELDELWIEWNGVVPFSQLQALLLHASLRNLCKIQKVIHIADGGKIENLLGRTGGALPEQISTCDFALVRNVPSAKLFKRIRHLLKGINPGVKVIEMKSYNDLYKQLFVKKGRPVDIAFQTVLLIVALHFVLKPLLEIAQIPVNTIINVFLGIMLQAVPFLLIGVLLSSVIQVFVPQNAIERRFPKSIRLGMVAAILAGFCLPVCDCASIPIFRSLVRKGIPLPVAVTFMTATPVINPVVILSTYYAFNGDMTIVISRVCLGIAAAVSIGLILGSWAGKGRVLSGGTLDQLMCSCGCYEDAESITTFRGKVGLFIRHSQGEFFSVGKYLVIGIFISSVVQTLGTGLFTTAQSGSGLAISMVIMMAMAFVLSLCSSSDAIVARSFANQFPMGGIMGFLVFGPMMDIKNVMMLSSGFTKGFIAKLVLTGFIVCFALVFLFYSRGGM
ncbi:permease [Desulfosporosinus shakirovi]|uniref:permease n=1 Tax=Desulfosporosinus shakirovi TaxID=2885154 RepID=UPI001E586AC1|nr:permease [Desulfosporosinus sp. SRJS8]MCB8817088.1 permease [Desulfosporosinus sp. SRJS8]